MADRPILFSAPMVRALLAGTKTQTRRILKPHPTVNDNGSWRWDGKNDGFDGASGTHLSTFPSTAAYHNRIKTGDRLWVRETWQGLSFGDYQPTKREPCDVRYAATDPCADLDVEARGYPWRPSIFMPRFASRLTLTVTDVRVERLQDISEEDADAECFGGNYPGDVLPEVFPGDREQYGHLTMSECYGCLWDHINGKGAWNENPWVVAYTFTVHHSNIDQMVKEAA